MELKRVKGSFTLEAAIWMPFILFIMVQGITIGIEMYEETLSIPIEYKVKYSQTEELWKEKVRNR